MKDTIVTAMQELGCLSTAEENNDSVACCYQLVVADKKICEAM